MIYPSPDGFFLAPLLKRFNHIENRTLQYNGRKDEKGGSQSIPEQSTQPKYKTHYEKQINPHPWPLDLSWPLLQETSSGRRSAAFKKPCFRYK